MTGIPAAPELDLRTYKLVPGGRATFDRLFREGALPMLDRHGIEVVGYGPSLVDDDHYYLARAFPSGSHRELQLEGFYGSAEWQRRERAVMQLIDAYHTVVVPLATFQASRYGHTATPR
jgi:NIPSNAP